MLLYYFVASVKIVVVEVATMEALVGMVLEVKEDLALHGGKVVQVKGQSLSNVSCSCFSLVNFYPLYLVKNVTFENEQTLL